MTLLSMISRSSVDRTPARCSGDHGCDSCPTGTQIFFFVPRSCHVDQFTFQQKIITELMISLILFLRFVGDNLCQEV